MVHSSICKLKSLPDYYAAKWGDHQAASRIAHAVVREAKTDVAVDYVVPVIQVDRGRYNAIPVAFGAVLAKHIGARLWPDGKCLICDDVVTYGATLANLRGFLVASGAQVLAATAMGAAYGSTKLAAKRSLIVKLERRYGQELERCTNTLGFRSECLTVREAYFLAGMRTVERIRDCLTQRVGSANRSRSIRV